MLLLSTNQAVVKERNRKGRKKGKKEEEGRKLRLTDVDLDCTPNKKVLDQKQEGKTAAKLN